MLKQLKKKIIKAGGFVNAHAHFDRAYTVHDFSESERKMHLHEKWKLNDKFKKTASIECYRRNIETAVLQQIDHGVSSACTFVDIDNITHGAALCAAKQIKDDYANRFDLKIACQTIKGVVEKEQQYLLDIWSQELDIIGSLPGADTDINRHLDIVLECAKRRGKRLHVHVDQLNHPSEKETELLARKTIKWGMEGRVTAIHAISLACHHKAYRKEVYKISQDAGLSFISCPSAWIDHSRREDLVPSHNSITPVDELLECGLVVAIGSDNIHDVYKPYSDGDMMFELRMLLEACKVYDEETLINIATSNGSVIIN